MRLKKGSIIFSVVIIVLLLLIGFSVSNILDRGTKEVKVAKKFIEELHDSRIIEEASIIEDIYIKEEIINKLSSNNSRIKYSVIIGNYGVDIDENYRVLGFSNKNLREQKEETDYISEEKAIYLAESYVSQITNDDFSLKEIRTKEGDSSLVYNVIFYKYKEGYPVYKQEINTLINKITGKLEGYTNYPLKSITYIDEVNIDENTAKKIINDKFEDLNLNAIIEGNPILAYINSSYSENVLAYIFNIKIITKENKEEIINSFVRADTGEVINYYLETVASNLNIE